MEVLIISLVVISLAVVGMAVGVIFSNKELKGSCGGLGPATGEECGFCGRKDECERRQEHLDNLSQMTKSH